MDLYSVEVKICATAYIKANSKAEARRIARGLKGLSPTILDHQADVPVSGESYTSPNLPDVSIAPCMTIHGQWSKQVELAERNVPEPAFRETFTTPFEQYRDRIGQPFTVLRKITPWNMTEADRKEYDAEALPMYCIRFADGHETSAFPEEVEEA